MTVSIRILPNGRMSLPADIRRRLGVSDGGELLVEETDEGLLVMTTSQAIARARAISRRLVEGTSSSVDDFLAERGAWQE
ncbi:AbrB/MazE/SpoVT family DNA-binding domain-containing protein [Pacificimonas flava]|nr:AbrB/MazE/SpoVT family DNA-binding domain-containing protein [Pacificimonas flava]MBB5281849.1 AbrB family looped-hinge helix DNA binding protein [Pacificimonas flava]